MDMRVVMEVVQSQLAASHSLLMDQLPAHIVKAVLSKMSSSPATPVAAAGASAAAQAQPQPPMRSQSQYGRLRRRSSAFQPATVALGADSDAVHMSDASLSSGSCAYNRWQRQQSLTVSGGSADRADSRELEVASMVSVSRLSSGSPALGNNDAAVAVAAALERPASASALRIRVTQPLRSSSSPAGNGAGNDGDVQRSGLHDGQDDRCGAAPRWQSSTTLQTITPTRLPSGSGAAGEGRHGTSSPGMRIEPLTAQSPGKPLQRKSLSTHMHRLCAALNGSHLTWLSGPPPSSPRHGVDGTYPKGDGAASSSGPEAGQLLEQVQRQDSSCPPDSDDLLASNHDSVTLFVRYDDTACMKRPAPAHAQPSTSARQTSIKACSSLLMQTHTVRCSPGLRLRVAPAIAARSDIVSFSSWAGKVEPTKVSGAAVRSAVAVARAVSFCRKQQYTSGVQFGRGAFTACKYLCFFWKLERDRPHPCPVAGPSHYQRVVLPLGLGHP